MWLQPDSVPAPLTLAELAEQIRDAVYEQFPDDVWVTTEIAGMKVNASSGHCYLDLADDGAHLRGCVWRQNYARVSTRFAAATGTDLQAGQSVLLRAAVRFHPRWGLSLDVRDVDPDFTIGDAARRRRETFARLDQEGWTQLNRSKTLVRVPQRIAVVSSPTAEGYHDFRTLLADHPAGYAFRTTLFPALVQGSGAPGSMASALATVAARPEWFDAVAVLRGGGASLDLACFDDYDLAVRAAQLPLPLLTGIGHENDVSALDLVAHTRCAVPREVAHFLLGRAAAFDAYLGEQQARLRRSVERRLEHQHEETHRAQTRLVRAVERARAHHVHQLDVAELRLRALDPTQLWQRGYTLTTLNGKRLTSTRQVKAGQTLRTWLPDGTLSSTINQIKRDPNDL